MMVEYVGTYHVDGTWWYDISYVDGGSDHTSLAGDFKNADEALVAAMDHLELSYDPEKVDTEFGHEAAVYYFN